jgi:hypothetical protein
MRSSPTRSLALVVLAALGAGCRAQAERELAELPPPPAPAWIATSLNRTIEARQAGAGAPCALEVRARGQLAWRAEACAAASGDRVFVSPDGERLLVVAPLPEHAGPDWSQAVVLTLWQRAAVTRRVSAGELLGARAEDMSRSYSWLRGVELGADPGAGARYAAGGAAVEIDTVAGRTFTVGFDGSGLPPAASTEALARADRERRDRQQAARDAADTRVYRWEDADGAVRFGSIAHVPAAYRARALPVEDGAR